MAKCATSGCASKGTMLCPTCKSMGIPAEYGLFCNQQCFKDNWALHKPLHKVYKQMIITTAKSVSGSTPSVAPWASSYSFTGPLRPAVVSPRDEVPDHIQKPDYWKTGIPKSEELAKGSKAIPVYTPEQIEGIRAVCKIGREVLDIASAAIRPGVTTDEIDKIVFNACVEREAYPSPLNYYHFPKSFCTSVNEVICHGIPDSRPLEDGDIINLDISVYKNGYHSDLNETFFVGNVDDDSVKLVRAAYLCLQAAVEKVKPGTMYREIGTVISKVAQAEGVSVVKTYCGHGIGDLFHCQPNVPHYARNKAVGVMKPGHIFTIEPMINLGTWQDKIWGDDWTAVTADGKRSAQFEHTLLVTEDGCEILTARTDQPNGMEWDRQKFQRPLQE